VLGDVEGDVEGDALAEQPGAPVEGLATVTQSFIPSHRPTSDIVGSINVGSAVPPPVIETVPVGET
jgi:hypothetical protein